jgi:hypothetical protein
MKTALMTLITVAISFLSTNTALAQNKPLACQENGMAGLKWENGNWTTKKFFSEGKFILVQTKDGLTVDSVAKAIGNDYPNQVFCKTVSPQISCMDGSGTYLYFDPRTLKGGISNTFGSTSNGSNRDTVSVAVFSCTPF